MSEFAKRLRWCIKHGDLTVADLQHWFDRPYATVRTWVFDARVPRGPAGRQAFQRLRPLELKIRRGFSVPVDLSNDERPVFIRKLRDESLGLSQTHLAR
jgi:hypothetical protein